MGKVKLEALDESELLRQIDALPFHQAIVNVETIKYFVGKMSMPQAYHEDANAWLKEYYLDHAGHTGGTDTKHIFVWVASQVHQHLRQAQLCNMAALVPGGDRNLLNVTEGQVLVIGS